MLFVVVVFDGSSNKTATASGSIEGGSGFFLLRVCYRHTQHKARFFISHQQRVYVIGGLSVASRRDTHTCVNALLLPSKMALIIIPRFNGSFACLDSNVYKLLPCLVSSVCLLLLYDTSRGRRHP